jgi:hypothetical protein
MGRSEHAAANELRAVMQGKVVAEAEDAYTDVRQVWNGAVEHQPALFALCSCSVVPITNGRFGKRMATWTLRGDGRTPRDRATSDRQRRIGAASQTKETRSVPSRASDLILPAMVERLE